MFDANPLGEVEDRREQMKRRNTHSNLEIALLDYADAENAVVNNTEEENQLTLKNNRLIKFNEVIDKAQTFCEIFEVSVPYIENEWRYYEEKVQKAELAKIEKNQATLEKFFEKFPFEGHDKKIEAFIQSIDAVARSRIGCYEKEVE